MNKLSFSQASNGLNVTTPADPNLASAGHYMLFILNGDGVPSVSQIIQIAAILSTPSPPALLSPADRTTGVISDTTLKWHQSDSATSFQIQLSIDSSFRAHWST